jgi:hypothetical protein
MARRPHLVGAHASPRRLRAAAAVVAADPPLLIRSDLVDDLPALAAQSPPDATLVVFHSSVLYHVPTPRRGTFAEVVRRLPGHWIADDAADVLPYDTLHACRQGHPPARRPETMRARAQPERSHRISPNQ